MQNAIERTSAAACQDQPSSHPPECELDVFSYWGGGGVEKIEQFVEQCKSALPCFRIYTDEDILPLLETHFAQHIECYKKIRFPSAKSDIARLLVLYDRGGLYADCHFGVTDPGEIRSFVRWCHQHDIVLVDNALGRDKRPEGALLLINGFIFSKPKNPLIFEVCQQAIHNLEEWRERERNSEFERNCIWYLSGPAVLNAVVFRTYDGLNWTFKYEDIRGELATRYAIVKEEDLPARRNIHISYRSPGQHWSERGNSEQLFESDLA